MNIVETPRLSLREMDGGDAPFILRLLNEDGFLKFIGDKGVRSIADACDYISKGPVHSYRQHGFGLYLTSLKDGTPIGMCGLVKRDTLPDVDLGFAFAEQYWSRGYASESAGAVLRHGYETLRLERIVAITAVDNRGSMAVLERIGLHLGGRVKMAEDGPQLNLYVPLPRKPPW